MSSLSVKGAPVVMPSTGIEKLKGQTPTDLESEKVRLRKATQEFEAFFMYQMLKTMRKTIPESSFGQDSPLSGDKSKEIFTDMFDMQLSQKMVTGDSKSISEILYNSLEKVIDAQYATGGAHMEMKPLDLGEKQPIKYEKSQPAELPKTDGTIKIEPRPERFLQTGTIPRRVRQDPVISRFGSLINEAARANGLDPALITAVIRVESNGDPNAISHAGAKGLMQLIDSTADDYGVNDSFDPQENVRAGSRYLKDLLDRFESLPLALAAYNAGPGNVMRYGGVPPFKETEAYVDKILDSLNISGLTAAAGATKVER